MDGVPANLENSAVATGLEKVSFHSNPKERQCQRMFKLLLKQILRVLCYPGFFLMDEENACQGMRGPERTPAGPGAFGEDPGRTSVHLGSLQS